MLWEECGGGGALINIPELERGGPREMGGEMGIFLPQWTNTVVWNLTLQRRVGGDRAFRG